MGAPRPPPPFPPALAIRERTLPTPDSTVRECAPFPSRLCQHWVSLRFFNFLDIKWYLITVFICISLFMVELEHPLYVYWQVIFSQSLFRFLSIFHLGCLFSIISSKFVIHLECQYFMSFVFCDSLSICDVSFHTLGIDYFQKTLSLMLLKCSKWYFYKTDSYSI